MYVSNLAIDCFGVCSDLSMDALGRGLNLVHGPRASGKTTVAEFVRSVLFGFDSDLRGRYQPAESRPFGGAITLQGALGRRKISRYDDGAVGRLRVEDEQGFRDQTNPLRELYGQVSPRLLEQVFAIDFEREPRADRLLDLATQHGFDLQEQMADDTRHPMLERDLVAAKERLANVPEPRESWELLVDRRRRLLDEITVLEARERQAVEELHRDRARQTAQLADSERLLKEAQRETAALDIALKNLLERRRLTELDRDAVAQEDAGEPWQSELEVLDAQLDRARRVLRDLAVAKNDSLSASDRSVFDGAREAALPRQHLKAMESTTAQLHQTLLKLNSIGSVACSCRELRSELETSLRQLRSEIYEACHALNVWQTYYQQRIATVEDQQFARCESELKIATQLLTERRQRLLDGLARPVSKLRPDHEELCGCVEHPKLIDKTTVHRPRLDSLMTTLAEMDAELRSLEEQRSRAERQVVELTTRLNTARRNVHDERVVTTDLHREVQAKRDAVAVCERLISEWERRREIQAHVAVLEEELRTLAPQASRNPILNDASELARRMSSGEIRNLSRTPQGRLWAETHHGVRHEWSDLAPGLRDITTLAVCLSLVSACERRGTQLPMVMNTPFSHLSDSQVAEAIRCLQNFGSARQILCFTRDEHAVRAARGANIPVGLLTVEMTNRPSRPLPVRHVESVPPVQITIDPVATRTNNTASRLAESVSFVKSAPSIVVTQQRPSSEAIASLEGDDFDSDESDDDWSETDGIERLSFLNVADLEQLRRVGVLRIQDLLNLSVDVLTARLRESHISRGMLAGWQTGTRHRLQRRERRRSRSQRENRDGRDYSRTSRGQREGRSSVVSMASSREGVPRFYLSRHDSVEAAPSIGPTMAKKLAEYGVISIADLLTTDAASLAEKLGHARTKAETIRQWQQQAELVCRIPQLRGHDAQVLVALGVTSTEDLAKLAPAELWGRVEPFIHSSDAKRILRGNSSPDLAEVTEWIQWANQARSLAAA